IALEGLLDGDLSMSETHYYFDIITDTDSTLLVDYRPVIQTIVTDIHQEVSKKIISQRFHSSIVNMIVTVCQQLQSQFGNRPVVLSGGVFLNEFILVNTLIALRQQGIQVFSHRDVPTGDGGIALGQLAITSSIMKEFDS
nr:carbamoyltransferase HypF [Gammaproteobacteria bacterium]